MTENPEVPGEEPRKGSTAPGLEGEGGQYVDGDYGDAGTVGEPAGNLEDGEYEDGTTAVPVQPAGPAEPMPSGRG
jgi:hypothetical protein